MNAYLCLLCLAVASVLFFLGMRVGMVVSGNPGVQIDADDNKMIVDGRKFHLDSFSAGRVTVLDPNRELLDHMYDEVEVCIRGTFMMAGYTTATDGKRAFISLWEKQ